MRKITVYLLFVILMAASLLFPTTVESSGSIGVENISLVTEVEDSDVAFEITNETFLKYSVRENIRFVVDSNGRVHISAVIEWDAMFTLYYITNVSGIWRTYDLGYFATTTAEIILDQGGNPIILAWTEIWVISQTEDYSTVQIDKQSLSYSANDIAIDANGVFHIVGQYGFYEYTTNKNPRIWYGNNSSGSWQYTMITSDDCYFSPHIAIDTNGNVHVSCVQSDEKYQEWSRVIYLTNSEGVWSEEIIDTTVHYNWANIYGRIETDIYTTSDGTILIACMDRYYELANGDASEHLTGSTYFDEILLTVHDSGALIITDIDGYVIGRNDTWSDKHIINCRSPSFQLIEDNLFIVYKNESRLMMAIYEIAPPSGFSLYASSSKANITLTWTAPLADASPVTSFEVFRGTSPSELTQVGSLFGPSHVSFYDFNVTDGQQYYYLVRAVNAIGSSSNGDPVSVVCTSSIPEPPLTVSGEGLERAVSVYWSPCSDNGGAPVTNYSLYRRVGLGEYELLKTLNGSTFGHLDLYLSVSVEYYYCVTSINIRGESDPSNEAGPFVPYAAFPDSPDGLTGQALEWAVELNWTAPIHDGGSSIISYDIYRSTLNSEWVRIASTFYLTYVDEDVAVGSEYLYYVTATNSRGESTPSSIVGPFTPLPAVPSAPISVGGIEMEGAIKVLWSPPDDDGGSPVQSYILFRRHMSDDWVHIATVDGNVLEFTDSNVQVGVGYSYYLTAKNSVGESVPSESAGPFVPSVVRQNTVLTIIPERDVTALSMALIINGRITDTNESGIPGLSVHLSYQVEGSVNTYDIAFPITNESGMFRVSWIPPASSEYAIFAEFSGDANYLPGSSSANIAVTNEESELFTVISTSSISNLVFDSGENILSFTVSGENGTTGNTRIIISKQLIIDASLIILTLDGVDMNYSLTDSGPYWVLDFEYQHSTHHIATYLIGEDYERSGGSDSSGSDPLLIVAIVMFVVVAAIIAVFMIRKRR